MSQLIREASLKARKTHQCSYCTGPIEPGLTYLRKTLVFDGRVYDWLTCGRCRDDEIFRRVWGWTYRDDGIDSDTAHEWASEAVEHGSPEDAEAARKFLERWAR